VESYAQGEVDIPDDEYDPTNPMKIKFSWKTLWIFTGPGWLMSMAYLDPGNLTSDLQQGAYTKYQLLWVLWWSTIAGWVLQVLSAKLGVVTGLNLAQMCRVKYPRWVAIMLFIQIEIAIIGADIQEVLGSAVAFKVLADLELWKGCVITAFTTFTFLAVAKVGVRILEWFFVFFIFIMTVCFMINWGEVQTNTGEFMFGWVVPEVAATALLQAVGIVGAVIMPHNLYLHSGLVQSRKIPRDDVHKVAVGNYYNAMESGIALLTSFFINTAVVCAFASEFYDKGCATQNTGQAYACIKESAIFASTSTVAEATTNMYGACGTAGEKRQCAQVGLQLAGEALKGSLGSAAKYVWGVGLMAAGQAATMTATYAGQFVMAGFLDLDLPMWAVMMITRLCAIGPAVIIAIIAGNNPSVSAEMNEWLNTLQSIQLPFALLPVLKFTSDQAIMGKNFVNSKRLSAVVWAMGILLLGVNIYFVIAFLQDPESPVPHNTGFYIFVALYAASYFYFIFVTIKPDNFSLRHLLTGTKGGHRPTTEMSALGD